ncbi:DUF447 family protein [Blastopirellula sp. JC732]|uniref:DUF447 family protein n=1 Tax=Blastopirellula sediminis TaxID=2894196 RepID=A0A9X1MIS4_9BACT|nr:DUF447 domain-containing protein [Blastopirellula sediminis]MCC9608145.1 DUF447 family protein [Blastopirellula sediminis]MCC9627062.1 DUF447 family protein [Blastopirellula sediminis]
MERLVLESLVTTIGDDGAVNVAPMGPLVDRALTQFTLRPFQTSRTFENLHRGSPVVVHVTDDVELLAAAAIGASTAALVGPMTRCAVTGGVILQNACRWYALKVVKLDDSQDRATIECEVAASGRLRDFFGLNRAKHAVVEAAILATRVDLLPIPEIEADLEQLRPLIQKTGGAAETRAFQQICDYVAAAKAR